MADTLTPLARSEHMRSIRKTNTQPELRVRRLAHAMGYRYRLHRRDLPGTPDLVFPCLRKVILVHGCFWHQHEGCRLARRPKSRPEYWQPKLDRNRRRDEEARQALEQLGWGILVVWECQTADLAALAGRIGSFLAEERRPTLRP